MACLDRGATKVVRMFGERLDAAGELMERAGRVLILEPGHVIIPQGEPCQGIYVIRSGLVGLRRTEVDGRSALLGLAGPGDVVGYRALLTGDFHSNSVEVLTACRALCIERSRIKRLLETSCEVRDHIVRKAMTDLNRSQTKCAALLTEGLRQRFVRLLLAIHQSCVPGPASAHYEIDVPIQRKDIAALIGAAPASLSRLLGDLESEGLIHVDGRRIEFSAAVRALGHGAFAVTTGSSSGNAGSEGNESVLAILMEARRALLSMIDAGDWRVRDALNEQVQTASAQLDAVLEKLARSGAARRSVSDFQRVWERFKRTRQTQIIPAIYSGKTGLAREIAMGIQAERLSMMQNIMSRCAN